MNSNVVGPKKQAICRYWTNNRTCFYGDECQFLHSDRVPNLATAVPPGKNLMMKGGIPDRSQRNLSNHGRMSEPFYQSSFNHGVGEHNFPFQQDLLGNMPIGKDDNAFPALQGNPSPESLLTDDMSSLSLAGMNDKRQAPNPGAVEFVPGAKNVGSGSEFIPGVSEFIPRAKIPSGNSFISSNNNSLFSPLSSNHLTAGTNSLSSGHSPLHSPKMTPTGSPILRHRTHSPLPPPALDINPATLPSQENPEQVEPNPPGLPGPSHIQENIGGTTYFYTHEQMQAVQSTGAYPAFHMYPGEPAAISYMTPKANIPSFFLSEELRLDLIHRHLQAMAQVDLTQSPDLPSEVDNYHSLCPLEQVPVSPLEKSSTFGYVTSCYKAISSKDSKMYCLRRIHGFRLVNTSCMTLVDMWKKLQHSNIVSLREVFTTKAFGDLSLVFAHDFHAGSETLMSKHFSNANMMGKDHHIKGKFKQGMKGMRQHGSQHGAQHGGQHAGLLPESVIWTYIVQLSSALRAIHGAGLACRVMDPTKILLTSKSRLRVNCVGIFDVLTFDNQQSNPLGMMPHYQQEDLVSLGKVVLALACHSVLGIQRENIQSSMELVAMNYSEDLKNLILYLLTNQRLRNVNDIMPMIGARFYSQLDGAQMRSDVIEEELAKEVQNGRLFRLLAKLNTICERPEFAMDPAWAETGDRYLLKLFRDYVFHQVTETGAAWVDMAHIVQCLNKLDAGVPEKVSLMSRDEQNVLVVSYADLKMCFEATYAEIQSSETTGHHTHSHTPHHHHQHHHHHQVLPPPPT